jgi:poly-gamma-glutamate synthesis protein (capsule biosynthesis protein)
MVRADAGRAARVADLVVVWFHWGIERQFTPTGRQHELAAAALAGGADIVLGAHPHVLQPIERSGRRLVAWSLGNFVFLPQSPGTERSGVLVVSLDARGVRGFRLRPAIAGAQPRLTG